VTVSGVRSACFSAFHNASGQEGNDFVVTNDLRDYAGFPKLEVSAARLLGQAQPDGKHRRFDSPGSREVVKESGLVIFGYTDVGRVPDGIDERLKYAISFVFLEHGALLCGQRVAVTLLFAETASAENEIPLFWRW
jgi:hypothetical protein